MLRCQLSSDIEPQTQYISSTYRNFTLLIAHHRLFMEMKYKQRDCGHASTTFSSYDGRLDLDDSNCIQERPDSLGRIDDYIFSTSCFFYGIVHWDKAKQPFIVAIVAFALMFVLVDPDEFEAARLQQQNTEILP